MIQRDLRAKDILYTMRAASRLCQVLRNRHPTRGARRASHQEEHEPGGNSEVEPGLGRHV